MLLPHALMPKPPAPKPVAKSEPKKRVKTGTSGQRRKRSSSKSSAPRVSTKLPKTDVDPLPVLFGDKDLAYEIPENNLRYHTRGADSTWLPISSMPKELRPDGVVYLQTDSVLIARCRVKGIGFRDHRWTHEAPGVTTDIGPGATLELHKDAWDFLSVDLGPDGEVDVQGYRYITTSTDGVPQPWSGQLL